MGSFYHTDHVHGIAPNSEYECYDRDVTDHRDVTDDELSAFKDGMNHLGVGGETLQSVDNKVQVVGVGAVVSVYPVSPMHSAKRNYIKPFTVLGKLY